MINKLESIWVCSSVAIERKKSTPFFAMKIRQTHPKTQTTAVRTLTQTQTPFVTDSDTDSDSDSLCQGLRHWLRLRRPLSGTQTPTWTCFRLVISARKMLLLNCYPELRKKHVQIHWLENFIICKPPAYAGIHFTCHQCWRLPGRLAPGHGDRS